MCFSVLLSEMFALAKNEFNKHVNFAQNLHEHVSCRQGKTYDIINNTIDTRCHHFLHSHACNAYGRNFVRYFEIRYYEVPSLYLL